MYFSELLTTSSDKRSPRELEPYIDLWGAVLKQSYELALEGDKEELKWWEESPVLDWLCEAMGFNADRLRAKTVKKIKKVRKKYSNYLF